MPTPARWVCQPNLNLLRLSISFHREESIKDRVEAPERLERHALAPVLPDALLLLLLIRLVRLRVLNLPEWSQTHYAFVGIYQNFIRNHRSGADCFSAATWYGALGGP